MFQPTRPWAIIVPISTTATLPLVGLLYFRGASYLSLYFLGTFSLVAVILLGVAYRGNLPLAGSGYRYKRYRYLTFESTITQSELVSYFALKGFEVKNSERADFDVCMYKIVSDKSGMTGGEMKNANFIRVSIKSVVKNSTTYHVIEAAKFPNQKNLKEDPLAAYSNFDWDSESGEILKNLVSDFKLTPTLI